MYLKTYDEWRSTSEQRQNPAYRSFLVACQDYTFGSPVFTVFDDSDRPCKRWAAIDIASPDYLFHAVIINSKEVESTHFVLANLLDAHTTCAEHKDFRMFLQQRENIRAVNTVARSDKPSHASVVFDDGSHIDLPVEAQLETPVDVYVSQGAELFAGCQLMPGHPIFHVFDHSGVNHRIVCGFTALDGLIKEEQNSKIYVQLTSDDGQLMLEAYNPSCTRT